jgi:mannose/cellobiose epimerase-like protein (N-acyl-D-glucosamine 2-epimerase family)
MVEIAVALAAAQAAVAGIKQAIQVGKDAKDCLGEFMSLFDAQDQIQKASTEERAKLPPEKQKSAMSEALEAVIAAKKVREMTDELKQYLIWSGQADIWDEIQREHNAIVQKRKADELAAKRKAEEDAALRLKQRKERMLIAVVLGTGSIILYHLVSYIVDAWPGH